jgi:hypothetical protein
VCVIPIRVAVLSAPYSADSHATQWVEGVRLCVEQLAAWSAGGRLCAAQSVEPVVCVGVSESRVVLASHVLVGDLGDITVEEVANAQVEMPIVPAFGGHKCSCEPAPDVVVIVCLESVRCGSVRSLLEQIQLPPLVIVSTQHGMYIW